MNAFISGIRYFLAGFQWLLKPGVKRFVVIPLAINGAIFAILFSLFLFYVAEFNAWVMHFLPDWLHWLSALLWFLFIVSFLLFFVFSFVVFANIIAAPFNSLLAEKVEQSITAQPTAERGLLQNVRDVPHVIGRQFAILGYFLPRAFLLLLLFFVPLIQVVAPLLWFLFNASFMTLAYLDYPTDNHRLSFREMRAWLRLRSLCSLGFGMSVLIAMMVPLLNVLVMPAAVAGATLFWIEENRKPSS